MIEFGTPKQKNDMLDEIYHLFGANLSQGLHLDLLSKFINHDEQVGQGSSTFLKAPRRSKPRTINCHVMGIVWSS
jgi:hypothetical protein